MKVKSILFSCLFIVMACTLSHANPQKVLLPQNKDVEKIGQVKKGTIKKAKASWWGFDKEDSTKTLQDAINSGVSELIVDNTGNNWIVSKPITLTSNQKIVFEDGVIIEAKKGAFKGQNSSLFTGTNLTNVSLVGMGKAILQMHRSDYADPNEYSKSEHRHGITLRACKNVVISGLTVSETGGDGLYLGSSNEHNYNKNILVEDCTFDKNYRQGISVISAEDLIIRNCVITNTKGTAPEAGIDFEPNRAGQRLVNCNVEKCIIKNNNGNGILIYTDRFTNKSEPLSIKVDNCMLEGNSNGLSVNPGNKQDDTITGNVTVDNNTFNGQRVIFKNIAEGSLEVIMNNTILDNRKPQKESHAKTGPIQIDTGNLKNPTIGGITFKNTIVKMSHDVEPIQFLYSGPFTLASSITGDISTIVNKKKEQFDLLRFLKEIRVDLEKLASLNIAKVDMNGLRSLSTSKVRQGNNKFYTGKQFTFLQYAEKGQEITLDVTVKKVYDRETKLVLQDPQGRTLQIIKIPLNDNKPIPVAFVAEETGIYRLVRTQSWSQRIDVNSSEPGNGFLIEKNSSFLPKAGQLYFEVPTGIKEFSISIATGPGADVALLDPSGREVEKHTRITNAQVFTGSRADASSSEIWSIVVSNVAWDFVLKLYDPLVPIVSTNSTTLLRQK